MSRRRLYLAGCLGALTALLPAEAAAQCRLLCVQRPMAAVWDCGTTDQNLWFGCGDTLIGICDDNLCIRDADFDEICVTRMITLDCTGYRNIIECANDQTECGAMGYSGSLAGGLNFQLLGCTTCIVGGPVDAGPMDGSMPDGAMPDGAILDGAIPGADVAPPVGVDAESTSSPNPGFEFHGGGGCDCRAAPARDAGGAWLALLAVAGAAITRRRR